MGNPKISIITVVFNDKIHLEETIQSVVSQSYKNTEYIIIDGGSTDGTLDIIKKHDKLINFWQSEPDKGVYNAMNKSVEYVNGEYLIFLNSGDKFFDENVIKGVFSSDIMNFDIIYGNTVIAYDFNYSRIWESYNIKSIWKGMVTSHQSIFVKTDVMKRLMFNEEMKISADFNFIFRAYCNKNSFLQVPITISIVTAHGISDKKRVQSLKEIYTTVRTINPKLKHEIYYYYVFVDNFFRYILKKSCPKWLHKILVKIKY